MWHSTNTFKGDQERVTLGGKKGHMGNDKAYKVNLYLVFMVDVWIEGARNSCIAIESTMCSFFGKAILRVWSSFAFR